MTNAIDHTQKALSRLVTQFRESTNLRNYISSLLIDSESLEAAFIQLLDLRNLDTATGISLDIIGEIVGQPRLISDFAAFTFFGYKHKDFPPASNVGGYGDLTDPSKGAPYLSTGSSPTGSFLLSDETYRIVIRSRIQKNISTGTVENLIEVIKILFDDIEPIKITEGVEAEYTVEFGRDLSSTEINLVDSGILPKPAGVSVIYNFTG